MATLSDLKLLLFRIRGHLIEHPVFSRGSGTPVDDPAHARELAELDQLSLQLSIIVRELKSKANLLSLHEQNLWSLPRGERYRAANSIHSRQFEVEQVRKLANELQTLLEDLIERSGLLSEGELAEGISHLMKQLYHGAVTRGETQGIPDGLSYVPASQSHLGSTLEGLTLFVFVALCALRYLRKRRKQQ